MPLTAFKTYTDQHSLSGFFVLAMGWLGPIIFNFAWYANLFFLFGFLRLLFSTKAPIVSAGVAVLLSFQTFGYDTVLLNEGGTTTPVYGYGFGAILWLLANYCLLLAAGVRLRDRLGTGIAGSDARLVVFTAGGLMTLLGAVSVVFGIHDRVIGNELERFRLSGVAFKRGPICSVSDPTPKTLDGENKILEIKGDTSLAYPVNSPAQPLQWGFAIVRMNGLDYSRVDGDVSSAMFARPASGAIHSLLEVTEQSVGDHVSFKGFIRTKMTAGPEVLFDQTWKREHRLYYCPDYQSFPRPDENPRKVIVAATTVNEIARDAENLAEVTPTPTRVPFDAPSDTFACPSTMRLPVDLQRSNPETRFLGNPIRIGNGYYFPGLGGRAHVICQRDSTYLFRLGQESDSPRLSITIQKWPLNGAQRLWSTRVLLSKETGIPERARIRSAREEGGHIRFRLEDDSGQSAQFSVAVPQR